MNFQKIKLVDDSSFFIEFTLWNENANASIAEGDYVGVKRVKVVNFDRENLNTVPYKTISIEPTLKRL